MEEYVKNVHVKIQENLLIRTVDIVYTVTENVFKVFR